MQSIQKILNISRWNSSEEIGLAPPILSSEKLESITKIAIAAITIAITSRAQEIRTNF